jgi:hypothetical protein
VVLVAKTGMGSSAALITSLVGALLQFFGVVALPGAGAHRQPTGLSSALYSRVILGQDPRVLARQASAWCTTWRRPVMPSPRARSEIHAHPHTAKSAKLTSP